jgi:hypothetical protein
MVKRAASGQVPKYVGAVLRYQARDLAAQVRSLETGVHPTSDIPDAPPIQAVCTQPTQVVGHLACGELFEGAAQQFGDQGAEVAVGEPVGSSRNTSSAQSRACGRASAKRTPAIRVPSLVMTGPLMALNTSAPRAGPG